MYKTIYLSILLIKKNIDKMSGYEEDFNEKPISMEEATYILQDYIRLIMAIVIISNFVLIFLLKFCLRRKEKVELFKKDLKTNNGEGTNEETNNKKYPKVLIVTAHPDDELMFFYPTLENFIKNQVEIHVLCLTNGNAMGLGTTREVELQKVFTELKINQFKIVNSTKLVDNQYIKFDTKEVANELALYIRQAFNSLNDLSIIFTFDENGGSKHCNHISTSDGVM